MTAKAPYGDVTYADPGYQSDKQKRYPLDTAEHCKAAWSYINMPKNAGQYSAADLATIKGRIKSALKKYGVNVSDDAGRSQSLTPFYRSFPLEDISIRAGGDGRTVTAYAAVFNTPAEVHDQDGHYLEELDPAVFNRAISDAAPQGSRAGWRIGVFYNHGMTLHGTPSERHSMPIGVPLDIKADARGVLTVTRYNKNALADEVLETIRDGSLPGYSFSGMFRRSEPLIPRGGFRADRHGNLPTVRRTESTMREYGPTPFPAYQDAAVMGMRADMLTVLAGDPEMASRMINLMSGSAPADSLPTSSAPGPGLATEDSRQLARSGRPARQVIQSQRAAFLLKQHGSGNDRSPRPGRH